MKRISFLAVLAFLIAMPVQSAMAQADSDSTIWVIRTYDGNEFYGTILEENTIELRLQTENLGILTIAIKDIRSRKEVRPQAIIEG
jgi:ABC-type sugar transport system substrate-binding protein